MEQGQTLGDLSLPALEDCLKLLKQADSDNDTFSALLLITNHVRSRTFTAADQRTALETAGLEFVSRLLSSQSEPPPCPPDYYKCIGLSILSAWTVEPVIARHPAITDVLAVINLVISPESPFKTHSHCDSQGIFEQMCRDSEEIIYNLNKHEVAVDQLLHSNTLQLLLEYAHSPSCQNVLQVLESLSTVVMGRGEGSLKFDPDKLLDVIKLTAQKLDQNSHEWDVHSKGAHIHLKNDYARTFTVDIKDKVQCARILTSFLTGLSTVEVTVQMDWVRELVLVLRTLISVKLAPDDSQDVLGLVCALVNTAGPQVLSPEVSGDDKFLKAVVARVSVEIYMQLDCIQVHNACDRYPVLDRVYKLLSSIIQFLAETGEGIESSSIIIIYRKLVDISKTIMEFLFSVAYQEIQFPKKHIVVLISVRTLAAMLAEITEDVTPRLLELLPFFNLLCQTVGYSDDLVMDVTNTVPPALTYKSLEDTLPESCNAAESGEAGDLRLSSDHCQIEISSNELNGVCSSTVENSNRADPSRNTVDRFGHLSVADPDACEADNSSFTIPSSSSLTTPNHLHIEGQQCGSDTVNKTHFCHDKQDIISRSNYISLSRESIENFKAVQGSVYSLKTKVQSGSSRKVSFVEQKKSAVNDGVVLEQWKPMPDDVLGYLLPAYMCLLDSQEVVEVMSRCGTFQTVITFLKASLSRLLEHTSSGYPESTTINALSVIELVYTNYPVTAASLDCFQEFFDISLLTFPSLLTQPHPSALLCLKLLEVSLAAYRIQTRDSRETSALPQEKHSRSLLFKAAVEYLSSFYEIRQHKGRQLSLHIKKEFRVVWPLAAESWSGCVAGLCALVRSVEELQDSLATSQMFPDFLSFLARFEGLPESSDAVRELVKSMFSLFESAAEGSVVLCQLILRNHGQIIAKKFHLKKLARCLQNLSKQPE